MAPEWPAASRAGRGTSSWPENPVEKARKPRSLAALQETVQQAAQEALDRLKFRIVNVEDSPQTLRSLSSAVPKPIFTIKTSLESSYQDLQDLVTST